MTSIIIILAIREDVLKMLLFGCKEKVGGWGGRNHYGLLEGCLVVAKIARARTYFILKDLLKNK